MTPRKPRTHETVWHPVLRTSRDEIAETCREPGNSNLLSQVTGRNLARRVEHASEATIGQIAARAGDLIMDGGDYWAALVLAAERLLADRRRPSP